ncbi:hypothetical protein K438DRAFT_1573153 [Mycena galopus ATCC 62051]|nr:hypothetical protein K438DRAFT_1573153 [Mycena galopus ATCC 62051]
MFFWKRTRKIPFFRVNKSLDRYADRVHYVGIMFQPSKCNISAANYTEKASIACSTGYFVFWTEAYIGDLPLKEGRLLYMACIDPHLIGGADIIVDINDPMSAVLEKVQLSYLR